MRNQQIEKDDSNFKNITSKRQIIANRFLKNENGNNLPNQNIKNCNIQKSNKPQNSDNFQKQHKTTICDEKNANSILFNSKNRNISIEKIEQNGSSSYEKPKTKEHKLKPKFSSEFRHGKNDKEINYQPNFVNLNQPRTTKEVCLNEEENMSNQINHSKIENLSNSDSFQKNGYQKFNIKNKKLLKSDVFEKNEGQFDKLKLPIEIIRPDLERKMMTQNSNLNIKIATKYDKKNNIEDKNKSVSPQLSNHRKRKQRKREKQIIEFNNNSSIINSLEKSKQFKINSKIDTGNQNQHSSAQITSKRLQSEENSQLRPSKNKEIVSSLRKNRSNQISEQQKSTSEIEIEMEMEMTLEDQKSENKSSKQHSASGMRRVPGLNFSKLGLQNYHESLGRKEAKDIHKNNTINCISRILMNKRHHNF